MLNQKPDASHGKLRPNNIFTDLQNADRFLKEHRHHLRYMPSERGAGTWFYYKDGQWRLDTCKEVMTKARETVCNMYNEAADAMRRKQQERAQLLSTNAARLSDLRPMRAMVDTAALTASEADAFKITADQFDRRKDRLNTPSGLVHLNTGELKKHNPDQLCRSQTMASFDPDARCPRWMQFLDEIFEGNDELIQYVQRVIGYAITGETAEDKFFLCYGTGSNGKNTFLDTIKNALGDYAAAFPFDALTGGKSGVRSMEVPAKLMGKRFAIADETAASRTIDEALIKGWTGGGEVDASFLFSDSFSYTPTYKIFLSCNHKPTIKGGDEGIWRRIVLIPFNRHFDVDERDNYLDRDLDKERDGILMWAIRGAAMYYANVEKSRGDGLLTPQLITDLAQEYRETQDVFAAYIKDNYEFDAQSTVSFSEAYDHYCEWCQRNDVTFVSTVIFASKVEERRIQKKRTNKGQVLVGLKLTGDSTFGPKEDF